MRPAVELPFQLDRPLVFMDIESTGVDPQKDRIVELSIVRFSPFDSPLVKTRRFNPEGPIPAEATEVHGITDDDVAAEPRFRQCAQALLLLLDECDLAGFNIRRFDLPLLIAEFERAGHAFDHQGRRIIDALALYHLHEPRNLEAAVFHYLGRAHTGAHGAEADTLATAEVLAAQVTRYGLPTALDELDTHCDEMWKYETPVDKWWDTTDSDPKRWVFKRGKHKGVELGRAPRSYLLWMSGTADDMHPSVQDVAQNMALGRYG